MVEKPCLDGYRVRPLEGGIIWSGKRIADEQIS